MEIRLRSAMLLFLVWLCGLEVYAQPKVKISEEDDRMILAYTFYLKQKMSLDFVSLRFPTLKDYVDNTLNEWNREFIDSALTAHLKEDWTKNKDALYEKFIRVDNSGIGESQAKQFVDIVNDRTYGHIQSPILETFLIWHPKYMKLPEKEFFDGYTCKFSTKDTRNILPVNVNVIYPRSWKAVAGNKKTTVVENFISGFGLGNVSMLLSIEKSKTNYTKDRIAQLLTKESLQKGIQANSNVLDYKPDLIIDNCRAASITYSYEKAGEGLKKMYFVSEIYSTYYKNSKISLNFIVLSTNSEDVNEKFKKYQKLIKRITDNIVILSQWGQ
jgi:hypothetical protein